MYSDCCTASPAELCSRPGKTFTFAASADRTFTCVLCTLLAGHRDRCLSPMYDDSSRARLDSIRAARSCPQLPVAAPGDPLGLALMVTTSLATGFILELVNWTILTFAFLRSSRSVTSFRDSKASFDKTKESTSGDTYACCLVF